jgi:hypothetical protein
MPDYSLSSAAMAEWLSYSTRSTRVLCLNLDAIRHGITLDRSLTAICLGSPVRSHTDYEWHIPAVVASMRLVSIYEKRNWLSGTTLRQTGLQSRATASSSCMKNIELPKLSQDSTLYRKVAEKLSIFLLLSSLACLLKARMHTYFSAHWHLSI